MITNKCVTAGVGCLYSYGPVTTSFALKYLHCDCIFPDITIFYLLLSLGYYGNDVFLLVCEHCIRNATVFIENESPGLLFTKVDQITVYLYDSTIFS